MFSSKKQTRRNQFEREFSLFPEQYDDMELMQFRLEDIQGYYEMVCATEEEQAIDDGTWNELSMDDIFFHLNHTRSFIGEQVLYKKLRCFEDSVSEERICLFMENPELRIDAETCLHNIGKDGADYRLFYILDNLDRWKQKYGWIYRLIVAAFIVLVVLGAVTANKYIIAAVVGIGLFNLCANVFIRSKYDHIAYSLKNIKKIIYAGAKLCDMQELPHEKEMQRFVVKMKKVAKKMIQLQIRKDNSFTADLGSVIWDYLSGIFMYDVLTLDSVVNALWDKKQELTALCEFVGQLDMEIAIASYRNNVKNWCVVRPTDKNEVVAIEMVHPLLEEGVANDIHIQNRMVLTGSNASGKSTFMKAVATNCILGQVIHTASAREFAIPSNMRVISCMATTDDIISGNSYFVSELIRIQSMLELTDSDRPILLLFDELLRGTGYEQRIAISEAILYRLIAEKAVVIIATHDLQLVDLIKQDYESYYFESVVKDQMITFDYKLHKGINKNKNAIELLDILQYEPDIIARAKQNVQMLRNGCVNTQISI